MKKKPAKSAFQKAVENTPEIANCFQVGLRAMGSNSQLVSVKNTSLLCGSVELDACVEPLYPQDNRWDFLICYDGKIYFIEVHSAYTGEVSTVIKKLKWLKLWLNEKAPEIVKLKASEPFYWVQSGKFAIPKNSRQFRQLEQMKFVPIPVLRLG